MYYEVAITVSIIWICGLRWELFCHVIQTEENGYGAGRLLGTNCALKLVRLVCQLLIFGSAASIYKPLEIMLAESHDTCPLCYFDTKLIWAIKVIYASDL